MKAKLVNENIEFQRGQDPKTSLGLGYSRWPYLEEFLKEAYRRGYVKMKESIDPKYYKHFPHHKNVLSLEHLRGEIQMDIYYDINTPETLAIYIEEKKNEGEGLDHNLRLQMKRKRKEWITNLFWEY